MQDVLWSSLIVIFGPSCLAFAQVSKMVWNGRDRGAPAEEVLEFSARESFCEFRPNRYTNRRWRVRNLRDVKDRVTEWVKNDANDLCISTTVKEHEGNEHNKRQRDTLQSFALSNFFSKLTSAVNQNHFERGSLKMLQERGTRVTE